MEFNKNYWATPKPRTFRGHRRTTLGGRMSFNKTQIRSLVASRTSKSDTRKWMIHIIYLLMCRVGDPKVLNLRRNTFSVPRFYLELPAQNHSSVLRCRDPNWVVHFHPISVRARRRPYVRDYNLFIWSLWECIGSSFKNKGYSYVFFIDFKEIVTYYYAIKFYNYIYTCLK